MHHLSRRRERSRHCANQLIAYRRVVLPWLKSRGIRQTHRRRWRCVGAIRPACHAHAGRWPSPDAAGNAAGPPACASCRPTPDPAPRQARRPPCTGVIRPDTGCARTGQHQTQSRSCGSSTRRAHWYHIAGAIATLGIQRILLGIAAQAADDVDGQAVFARLEVQGPRIGLHSGMQGGNDPLAARVGAISGFRQGQIGRRAAIHDALVDGAPGFRAGPTIHADPQLRLHRTYHGLDLHDASPCVFRRSRPAPQALPRQAATPTVHHPELRCVRVWRSVAALFQSGDRNAK